MKNLPETVSPKRLEQAIRQTLESFPIEMVSVGKRKWLKAKSQAWITVSDFSSVDAVIQALNDKPLLPLMGNDERISKGEAPVDPDTGKPMRKSKGIADRQRPCVLPNAREERVQKSPWRG